MSEKDEIKNEAEQPDDVNPNEAYPEDDSPEGASSSFREVEKEDDDDFVPEKQSNKKLIGLLSLVILLALFIFFKGEEEKPVQEEVSIKAPQVLTPPAAMPDSDDAEEDNPDGSPQPGDIRIAGEDPINETNEKSANAIVPIPKEEFDIFEPLGSTERDRSPSESEELVLLKKAGPQPKPKSVPQTPASKPQVSQKAKASEKGRGYTIQLGAFKKRDIADKLDEQLRSKGYDSFVLAVRNDLFRVRVGSFKSREEAKVVASRIKKTDQLDSFITTE